MVCWLINFHFNFSLCRTYLKDLIECTHLFLKMLETHCKVNRHLIVQKKWKKGRGRHKKSGIYFAFWALYTMRKTMKSFCTHVLLVCFGLRNLKVKCNIGFAFDVMYLPYGLYRQNFYGTGTSTVTGNNITLNLSHCQGNGTRTGTGIRTHYICMYLLRYMLLYQERYKMAW